MNVINDRLKNLRYRHTLMLMRGGACSQCGIQVEWENILNFEFHHIDAKTKEFNIGCAHKRSILRNLEELRKCQILCLHCHKKHHHGYTHEEIQLAQAIELNFSPEKCAMLLSSSI